MAKRKSHRRRRALMNPFSAGSLMSAPKQLVSTDNIIEAAGVAAGFVLPGMVMNYLPATWRSTTLTYYASKVGTIVVLSAVGRMVSARVAKFVLVGGTVSLLLDLYTEFVGGKAPVTTTPAAATGTNMFYGDFGNGGGGMSMFYGD